MKSIIKIAGIASVVGVAIAGIFIFLKHRDEDLID